MTVSITRIAGFICTFVFCDNIFPPAKVPSSDILPESSISRNLDFENGQNVPIVNLQKYWPSSSLNNELEETVQLKGYYSRTVYGRPFSIFEGVPYARPPVGNLRFQEAEKQIDWPETFDATKKSPVCIQMDPLRLYNVVGQEDCLYLNIYAPRQFGVRTEKKIPVMVFLHGGSFFQGTGNLYGPAYLLDKDIVYVAINYRLGPFGFLSTGDDRLPGNIGLKDQALALNWVYYNIEAFGGDPNKITLFGESAGAVAVHLQMMSTRAKDLIFSAIAQSGTAFCHWAFPPTINLTNKFASNLGCDPQSPDLVECLRTIPARRLASSQYNLFEWRENPTILFGPVVEHKHKNAFISDSPEYLYKTGQVANIPLITGVNKDEGNLLSAVTYLTLSTRSMLRNLNRTLPAILMYPRNDFETTKKIKEFYLKDFDKPSLSGYEALGNIGQMFGDLFFYTGFEKTLEFHTNWTTSPVYGYFLSHQGKHGASEKFHVPTSQFGVMHADDLQYVFNSTELFYPLSPQDKDYTIVEYITRLWTNFATNGIPSLQNAKQDRFPIDTDSSDLLWRKFDLRERNLLNIDEKLSMIRQPYRQRTQFWKSTPYY